MTRRVFNSEPPVYFIENGLRKVVPYPFTYQTFVKERWFGSTLLQIFDREFKSNSPNYYRNAISKGRIKINGNVVPADYILKSLDIIESVVHRHERPVCDSNIQIVFDSNDLMVISKPGSIPAHPTARFNHNSVVNILRYVHGYDELHCVNRLDRLTSGLMILAKTKQKAIEMRKEMQSRSIQKVYLARVKGRFPFDEILCDESIGPARYKAGPSAVIPNGKQCMTKFRFLDYNGITSLVQCEPITGRTHQIRVHLQYLGFPIANDPLYGCLDWKKESKAPTINQEHNQELDGCFECLYPIQDPIPEQMYIWLHASQYRGEKWNFRTEDPDWALPGWNGDSDLEERFWKHGGVWYGLPPVRYS